MVFGWVRDWGLAASPLLMAVHQRCAPPTDLIGAASVVFWVGVWLGQGLGLSS